MNFSLFVLTMEYRKSLTIQDTCSDTVQLEYIMESARYNHKTYKMLSKFIKTGQVKEKLGKYVASFVNICYYNNTRIETNKLCSVRVNHMRC